MFCEVIGSEFSKGNSQSCRNIVECKGLKSHDTRTVPIRNIELFVNKLKVTVSLYCCTQAVNRSFSLRAVHSVLSGTGGVGFYTRNTSCICRTGVEAISQIEACNISKTEILDASKSYPTGSMFAGIGGICLAFKNAGADVVWANEIDPHACDTYRTHFGSGYLVEGDIKKIEAESIPRLDILTAGFPCQAFSVAGHRKGFDDERGALFFEIIRVIKAKGPRAVFIENVKNLVKHDGGKTFDLICEYLTDCGYEVDGRVFNTKEYGNIPQNRERVYIVAFKNGEDKKNFSWPEPVELKVDIAAITHPEVKAGEKFYYSKGSRYYGMLDESMERTDTVYQLRRTYVRENKNKVCPTLTANMGGGGHNVPLIRDDHGIRKLTPEECLMFQGFPPDFKFASNIACSSRYKQAGNSVSVPVVERIAAEIIEAFRKTDSE